MSDLWIGWKAFWPIAVTAIGAVSLISLLFHFTIENGDLRMICNFVSGLIVGYGIIGPWYSSKMKW